MCGIIGYVGKQTAAPILLEGLRRLEYRGYDSAGVALLNGSLQLRKKRGKIDEGLATLLKREPAHGFMGIGHTRWATHGAPTDENSHPHLDRSGKIAVVHAQENLRATNHALSRMPCVAGSIALIGRMRNLPPSRALEIFQALE